MHHIMFTLLWLVLHLLFTKQKLIFSPAKQGGQARIFPHMTHQESINAHLCGKKNEVIVTFMHFHQKSHCLI